MRELPTTIRLSEEGASELPGDDPAFWYSLIDEAEAARFLGFSVRHMQGLRYKGGGPKFCRLSARCVKYRRVDCRLWSEAHLRTSTSDPGPRHDRRTR